LQLRRQLLANPQRDCQFVSQREGHVLKEAALASSHLDLTPWNEQWWVHEPKEEHAGQIQTLLTGTNRRSTQESNPQALSVCSGRYRGKSLSDTPMSGQRGAGRHWFRFRGAYDLPLVTPPSSRSSSSISTFPATKTVEPAVAMLEAPRHRCLLDVAPNIEPSGPSLDESSL
jgi:hypothetical protein